MESIIKELYNVSDLMNISSCDNTILADLAMDNVHNICNILESRLDDEQLELLKNYTNAWNQAGDEIALSNFALGFKLGGRIATSMIHDDL